MENAIKTKQEKEKSKFMELTGKLDAYSPLKTLSRGYSITEKEGKIIKTKEQLNNGDIIDIRFVDGKIQAKIQ